VRRDTLIDFFNGFADTRGPFLVYDDGFRSRTFSYKDVARASRGFSARLRDAGIRKGDKVVFFSENRPEWIVAFWGCLLGGVVVVPIDYRASPDFLARVSGIVSAKLVLIGQDVPPLPALNSDAAKGVPVWRLQELSWIDGSEDRDPKRVTREDGAPVIGRDDVAEIIFTSGATAEPKGVVITHRNVLANIVPIEGEVLKYRKWGRPFFPLRFLNLLPLSHMFGQAMATFIPPMLPGVVIFMRGYNPGDIVAQIKSRRVSVLVSVPKILDVLREHVQRTRATGRAEGMAKAGRESRSALLRIANRWWRHRVIHRQFGLKFWAFIVGAAPLDPGLETFWGELGFAVIQGYGLTETAPIVSLNHPFGTKRGSVGKAIAGVEIKVAPDGEILVRGENVTRGYFGAPDDESGSFEAGWFHTGDVGELASDGQLFIRGRKKEMIVTPEGLNVFPEDVEHALNQIAGVRDSAVVGTDRVTAVVVTDPGADLDAISRTANQTLADHQKIRRIVRWPEGELPRTDGTRKLKRTAIREWLAQSDSGAVPRETKLKGGPDALTALVEKYAGRGGLSASTTLDELGLSSLERVELMVALEDAFQAHIDEGAFADARDLSALRTLVDRAAASDTPPADPVDFPSWNRAWPARAVRRASLPTWILPIARLFAWLRVDGRNELDADILKGPVIFASNHQSHMDTPVILAALPARLRYRVATAMAKEFFKPHFFPGEYSRAARFTNGLNYYLASLFFNAFPLPQREAGARQTLRYIGDILEDGFSVLIFPEGKRTDTGEIDRFRPGIGMIASRLGVPVVPVRIEGLDKVLHHSWRMAKPGRVRVAFGRPLHLTGDDYEGLAHQVEEAVRHL
jgi:long-chain acyl-CoA synthetase